MATEKLITEHLDLWTAAIKRRSTAGRGSSRKVELYGIKKLRELILELAVRGLLVPQDAKDEPASELHKKIAAEKARLIKEKEIRNLRPLAAISDEEKFMPLPAGWSFARLNDMGDWGAGATPSRNNPELYGGSIPWFKSGELVADYISQSEETVTELALEKASLRYNKVGDVLIAMYGATIGKTAILSVPATTNQAVCACTPFPGFESTYLLTLLKAYRPRFIGMGAGGAQPNISREKIIETVVAVPPTAEQHRIVAKVDELMALCDQLEQQTDASLSAHQTLVQTLLNALISAADHTQFASAWQRIAEHFDILFTTEESIDQLKQTILQLAVMGKLVPQDPNDEPAGELLKKIAAEKAKLVKAGKVKQGKALPQISGNGQQAVPSCWSWACMAGLGEISPRNDVEDDAIVSFVPMTLISTRFDGRHDHELKKWADIKKGYTHFSNGDVAIAKITPCFENSKAAIFSGLSNGVGAGTTELHVVRLYGEFVNRSYLLLYLKSPQFLRVGESKMTGSAGQKRVPTEFFSLNPLPLPPLAEQYRIVAKVNELMTLCDQLKSRLSDVQVTQLNLADALAEQALVEAWA